MRTLKYDGPGHVLVAYGKEIPRGDRETFDDDQAAALLKHPRLRMTDVTRDRSRHAPSPRPDGEGQSINDAGEE
jgi:hypothetical protein